jgi:transcriptional regulator with XRE-family HTH domain
MEQQGLTEEQLAKKASVSQATVWRALNGKSQRRGAARSKLFKYVKIDEWLSPRKPRNAREGVMVAFDRIWDQSEAHAEAISRVIDALADLRPRKQTQGKRG